MDKTSIPFLTLVLEPIQNVYIQHLFLIICMPKIDFKISVLACSRLPQPLNFIHLPCSKYL